MADFSFHSNTDESAVEQILAEAMDHCVLDQITAINCSSFSHSVLPSHLESRFQRLKTFPSSSSSSIPKPQSQLPPHSANELKNPISSDSSKPQERERERHSQRKPSSGYVSSPSGSSNSSSGFTNSPKLRAKSVEGKGKEGKSPSGSLSFRSDSSVSPPKTKKSGCFWCSPKRVSRKKNGNRNGVVELGLDWGEHDEILTDLKSFSSKEQKKRMKKAMKEEEKLNKEAEKIVKWAKQASARLDFSIDDYDDDDDDSRHDFGLH